MKYKLVFCLLATAGLFSPFSFLFAFDDVDLTMQFNDCAKISVNKTRLVCFDKLVNVRATPVAVKLESSNHVEVSQNKVAAKNKENDFAKEHIKKSTKQMAQELTTITATIEKVKQLIRGQWVIYLDNGQKWQQKDNIKIKLRLGDQIRLEKGAMGSVFLYKQDSHRGIKVKRLQ